MMQAQMELGASRKRGGEEEYEVDNKKQKTEEGKVSLHDILKGNGRDASADQAADSDEVKSNEGSEGLDESTEEPKVLEKDEDNVAFELSKMRRVAARRWKSSILIHIREYYEADGEQKPGRKGVALSMAQWEALKKLTKAIDKSADLVESKSLEDTSLSEVTERTEVDVNASSITFQLPGKRRVQVKDFKSKILIDIREYYEKNGMWLPGKKGISLPKEQWDCLKGLYKHVSDAAASL